MKGSTYYRIKLSTHSLFFYKVKFPSNEASTQFSMALHKDDTHNSQLLKPAFFRLLICIIILPEVSKEKLPAFNLIYKCVLKVEHNASYIPYEYLYFSQGQGHHQMWEEEALRAWRWWCFCQLHYDLMESIKSISKQCK